ncbi:MAG TPA: GNAT family protein [Jatrophihabitans sp.]|nr:GNAT family protein [Jatrophihabitans sp.]
MGFAAEPRQVLENEHVLLRPITPEDRAAQRAIAIDESIWRYFITLIQTDADFDAFFDAALADQEAGRRVVFHIIDKGTGQAAGSMSFGNLSPNDLRLEIGWSWLGIAFQGKGINRWAKFLMLQHAFENLAAERVEFKTDVLNVQARHALRNIGATEEGVLRSYNPMPGGRRRDAIYYSVLRGEWPAVKEILSSRAKVPPVAAGP